jgi:hypothetical protein
LSSGFYTFFLVKYLQNKRRNDLQLTHYQSKPRHRMKNYKVLTCLALVIVSVIQSGFKRDDQKVSSDVQPDIAAQEVEKFSGIYNAAQHLDAAQSENLTQACSLSEK